MYLADYHTHTLCSEDSQAPLEEMARAAADAGLAQLCTTDHCDLVGFHGEPVPPWDWTPVLEQYDRVRRACPAGLELRLGLELGSAQFFPHLARDILAGAPVDFVIGSAHNLHPDKGGVDFYFLPFQTEQECRDAMDDYFDSLTAIAALDTYDVIGHIIYPLRYINGRAGHHLTLDPWRDRLEALLKTAIHAGKGIEVNTHCGRELDDWLPILKLYRALGGEIVTLGSDAHHPENVGKGLVRAAGLLEHTGFDYITVYRGRRPEFKKISI